MSPRKKKARLLAPVSAVKRENNDEELQTKRRKLETSSSEDLQCLKRKNFIKACEHVSYYAYTNYAERLHLIYLPRCMDATSCKHHDHKDGLSIKQIPTHIEESFKIEMKSNMWSEALEVCYLCVTSTQYLSADVLKDVVEIIMNAHEDSTAGYTVTHLINQCQQILGLSFSTHPPCLMKNIRKSYNNFLTSPMDPKDNTFTNRKEFGCDKGIVKYCMNRLDYEISDMSKDEPIINKYENIPDDMKQSVKGLHWQKEKLEIFELLERPDRIERLMAVLNSIIELLQFNLAIWHSRYTNNLGCHIMRSHKPLMAYVLWSNNVLYTGAVNGNCRQILRIFSYFIHLQYPEEHIKTMTIWLNTVIQTFYICENNSNSDYPNTGKYCAAFATEFYKIISELPHESINRILERIQPTYMRHLIGTIHIKTLLSTTEDNLIRILITSLKDSVWNRFPTVQNRILIKKPINIKNIKSNKFLKLLSNKCKEHSLIAHDTNENDTIYPKFTLPAIKNKSNRNDIIYILYITFQAYLDAYSVQNVQETLDMLNDQLDNKVVKPGDCTKPSSYTVSEHFIKGYRLIYQLVKELIVTLNEIQNNQEMPPILKIFENLLNL